MTKCYHGSAAKFESFSYSEIGKNGTNEGIGFYFTSSESIARGYATKNGNRGFLYTVEFTGKKSLSSDKKTITRGQLKHLLQKLGSDYLNNYMEIDFYGIDRVIKETVNQLWDYNENDVDLISCIGNADNNWNRLYGILESEFGFDSIVLENPSWGEHVIYIALTHNAYEILDVREVISE